MELNHLDCCSIFKGCNEFAAKRIDLDKYSEFPTVKHRKKIINLCQQHPLINTARTYCLGIVDHKQNLFYTTNDPYLYAGYMSTGLCRADNFFLQAQQCKNSVLLGDEVDESDIMRQFAYDILKRRFNLYNAYCLIRYCADCIVIIAITGNHAIDNPQKLYLDTYQEVENFSVYYLNMLIDLYVSNLPTLKYSRFSNDVSYRQRVIQNKYQTATLRNCLLTERETECLYWLSCGKKSSEIAFLMNISPHTVVEYRKKIISKLNVANVVHAVRVAVRLGII